MAEWLRQWRELTADPLVGGVARALATLLVAWLASGIVDRTLNRLLAGDGIDAQRAMLLRRAATWTLYGIAILTAVRELGVDLRVLLGAAGVLSVAIGFASQTSASNLISGLFLIVERPFAVGDIIRIGTTSGTVLSIDLLSIKLRTLDNLLVRVPNESVLKTEVTNLTRFPIRRYELEFAVPYSANLAKVEAELVEVADELAECLTEPRPVLVVDGFGESGVRLRFAVWTTRDRYINVRRTLPAAIKARLESSGIGLGRVERMVHMVAADAPPALATQHDAPSIIEQAQTEASRPEIPPSSVALAQPQRGQP